MKSLLVSSVLPTEIILIDNNCSDQTIKLARACLEGSRVNLVIVKESRQGVRFARVTGCKQATSDVIINIDADSEVNPQMLQKLTEAVNWPPKDYGSHSTKTAAASSLVEFSRSSNLPRISKDRVTGSQV